MSSNKVYSMVSLAKKAGKLVSGEFSVDNAGKSGAAKLIILATDASDRTKKSVTDMCRYYEVPCYFYGTKEELGRAIGKENRAQIAITDENFARGLKKILDGCEATDHRIDIQGEN